MWMVKLLERHALEWLAGSDELVAYYQSAKISAVSVSKFVRQASGINILMNGGFFVQ